MKIALVTGGSGKIGSRIVLHLLSEGYKVVTTYNKSVKRIDQIRNNNITNNKNLLCVKCDLTIQEDIENLFIEFKNHYTSLDLLINCAGVFHKNNFNRITEAEYDYVMSLNLKSVYFLIQKFTDLMTENSVVINFASVGGIIPWPERSLYYISKAGVIALTRSLALELSPKVRIVSIAPGYIEIENTDEEKMPISKIPLKRYGNIEHIIQTIDYIINNDYLTGITIPIDGGRSLI